MSDAKRKTVGYLLRKKKKKKTKMKKFLLTSKKSWLIEDELFPFYQHLVDSYCVKLKEEWKFDVQETRQVKEEPMDDLVEPNQIIKVSGSTVIKGVKNRIFQKLLFTQTKSDKNWPRYGASNTTRSKQDFCPALADLKSPIPSTSQDNQPIKFVK